MTILCHLAITLVLAGPLANDAPVGRSNKIEQLVLPGPELEAKPLTDGRSPIVLRVVAVYPHGTAFRYDLEYYGLEAGSYDLKNWLQRKDGSPPGDLPAIPVTIVSSLPAGQVLPTSLQARGSPRFGGYLALLILAAVLWVIGLVLIVLYVKPKAKAAPTGPIGPVTAADRLRPLVQRAMAGDLTTGERADLERMLLAFWRKRLQLEHEAPAVAFAKLKADSQAGPLITQLEEWLHHPNPDRNQSVEALLEPYRLPESVLEVPAP